MKTTMPNNKNPNSKPRCAWVPIGDALYEAYHDTEWGVPLAHMQATGMVNDHTVDCFRYKEVGGK